MRILYLTDAYLEDYGLDSFRQGIRKAFETLGHEVGLVVANKYLIPGSSKPMPGVRIADYLDAIPEKDWDLVFTLNRAGAIAEVPALKRDTPVLTWYIDSPARLSPHLKQHKPNEHVFIPDETYLPRLAQEPGLSTERTHYLPFATTPEFVSAAEIHSDAFPAYRSEVSFVGSLFSMRSLLDIFGRLNRDMLGRFVDLIEQHQADYHRPIGELIEQYQLDLPRMLGIGSSTDWNDYLLRAIDDFLSSKVRIDYLDAAAHRDLKIYGNREWLFSSLTSLQLLRRCMLHEVGADELRAIYRSSKVLLNICHVQARSGLPFRVFDILACGGFLLSEYRDDLARLFKVGKELEVFHSKQELREKLELYLADDDARQAIAARGRQNVMEHHLIEHRVKEMLAYLEGPRP